MTRQGIDREVIFETVTLGGFAKVTAVDVATGVEACAFGPPEAATGPLRILALRKLEKLLEDAPAPSPPPGRFA